MGTFSLQSKTMYDKFGNFTPEQYFMKTDTELTCMKFYRRILMTNKYTTSLATVGELGRYPAHISIISKIIKFWHRMANLDESCLLKSRHIMWNRANFTEILINGLRSSMALRNYVMWKITF